MKKESIPKIEKTENNDDNFPEPSKSQTNQCYTKIIDITGITAMDFSEKFRIISTRGNKYIFL